MKWLTKRINPHYRMDLEIGLEAKITQDPHQLKHANIVIGYKGTSIEESLTEKEVKCFRDLLDEILKDIRKERRK